MSVSEFTQFLEAVDLRAYRARYSAVKLVEMNLPKAIQAIELMYRVYWDLGTPLCYEGFYNGYMREKKQALEEFRTTITMCKDCFYRGIEARIYRTWAGVITQIHAGYVAESVFGRNSVSMSSELDSKGADIQVRYKGKILNYQVKKTSYSGVRSSVPLPVSKKLEGEFIEIKYEVPVALSDPRTKAGEFRKPYLRFLRDKRTSALGNNFVVFTKAAFAEDKLRIDSGSDQSRG